MKIDPNNHKERYLRWKERYNERIPKISETNSGIVLDYLHDMEHGLNIGKGSKKGARSYNRLNNLKQRMIFLTKKFEEIYNLDNLYNLNERHLHKFFTEMRNGTIKRLDGKIYRDPANFVKIIKAFWHWHQKVNRKKGIEIYDITQDLDTSVEKPKWVYLTEKETKELYNNAKYKYKVLIMFLLDTGVRAPSELINIKVSDFQNDCKELIIRDEISKTFGRRIKLMICSETIKEYIETNSLKESDHIFPIKPDSVNKYLQRLSKRIFGNKKSPAGQKYSDLTMYDFRHCSCCYWMPRYKSESALKYRFGWKKSDKIHYYSDLLGMRDTITEEDLLIDVTKTEIEKQLQKSENENGVLQERVEVLEGQMKILAKAVRESLFKGRQIMITNESFENT
ncbi:tyrosine-type recombinase/integrase [Methanococcoides sp. SA1]|nr:tyrosine-type recombinase/integrase [Methanococcoides sp. SA1]